MQQNVRLTLEVSSQNSKQSTFLFEARDKPVFVGRLYDALRMQFEQTTGESAAPSDVCVIRDQEVSSVHCKIWYDVSTQNFYVQDENSTGGTFFAGPAANKFQHQYKCIGSKRNHVNRAERLSLMCVIRLATRTTLVVKRIEGLKRVNPNEMIHANPHLLAGNTLDTAAAMELGIQIVGGPGVGSSVVVRYPESCLIGRASAGSANLKTAVSTATSKKAFPANKLPACEDTDKVFTIEDPTNKLSRAHFLIEPVPGVSITETPYSESFTLTLQSTQGGCIVKSEHVPPSLKHTGEWKDEYRGKLRWKTLTYGVKVPIDFGDIIKGGKSFFRVANNLGPPARMDPPKLVNTMNEPPCMHFSWKRPLSATEIKHYMLELSVTGEESGRWDSVYAGAEQEFTLEFRPDSGPLEEGRPYYFRIKATNSGGPSEYSSVVCHSTYSLFYKIDSESSESTEDDNATPYVPTNFDYIKVGAAPLGRGAFGDVWLVQDNDTGVLMALKNLEAFAKDAEGQEAKARKIEREIIMMRSLNHPNVVRYMGATRTRSSPHSISIHIFMEYVPNGSLRSFIKKHQAAGSSTALPEHMAATYVSDILEGLNYLHSEEIVHGDIKSDNVLLKLREDGRQTCMINDFGCSRSLRSLGADAETSFAGTPAFMAPEVIKAKAHQKSDVWSVGCTLIEMITGVAPWSHISGNEREKLIWAIAQTECGPPVPEFASATCCTFLQQCFAIDIADRSSAAAMLEHVWITSPPPRGPPRIAMKKPNFKVSDYITSPLTTDGNDFDFVTSPVTSEAFPMSPLTVEAFPATAGGPPTTEAPIVVARPPTRSPSSARESTQTATSTLTPVMTISGMDATASATRSDWPTAGDGMWEEGRSETFEAGGKTSTGQRSLTMPPELVYIQQEDLQLVVELGKGAFGTVSKYKFLGSEVAVKTLRLSDPVHVDELINEAIMLRNINHPKCIQFMGVTVMDEDRQAYGIVTEYMAGGDLHSLLHAPDAEGLLDRSAMIRILCDIVRALVFLHAKDIVHRDIKPGNILLEEHKRGAKLADFGLSAPGRIGGTARYAAPEAHIKGVVKGSVGKASDIYSLGVVAYELFTRLKPFADMKASEIATKRLPNTPPGPVGDDDPRFPPTMLPVLKQCWSADVAARPTAVELLEVLEKELKSAWVNS